MTSGGVEALKAALRRSLPLIIGLIVLGVVAVNVFKQVQGPRYEATAKVLVSSTPLASIISGTQPSFVDPARVQQTALGIAESSEVYQEAAKRDNQSNGSAGDLQSAVSVTADANSDLIAFTSSSSEADDAVGKANAVARGFIAFRTKLATSQVESTVKGLQAALDSLPPGSPRRGQIEEDLNKLQVLQDNASDTTLVEAADSASQTSPAPIRDSIVGFSIGLIIALVLVAVREAIDTTVRSEVDVEDLLSVPVLASVRSIPRRNRIVTYGRHEAEFSDAYALLAAQLVHTRAGDEGAAMAVTSSIAKEGKTTTAANLAVAIARRGSHVILADFDFRKPGLEETFGIPAGAPGALQVMSQRAPLERACWTVSLEGTRPQLSNPAQHPVHPPKTGGTRALKSRGSLRVLPTGGATRSAPQQEQLQYLLGLMRADADLVILDTPPALLTVEVSELAPLVDVVLLVVRHGQASQRNLRNLQRQLRTWPAEVVGAVMTDIRTDSKQGYPGNYGYSGKA
jgi:capsular polysaccharide biosynthesis protein/cellulose biosynthesis protein BcsQ